jgi:hypothetical protein
MVEPTLRLKSVFIGHDHVANRIGLQILPYELARIVIWRIERQIKWSQFSTKRSHEFFIFFARYAGPRSTIGKIVRLAPTISRFKNSMKISALAPLLYPVVQLSSSQSR